MNRRAATIGGWIDRRPEYPKRANRFGANEISLSGIVQSALKRTQMPVDFHCLLFSCLLISLRFSFH